MDRISWKSTSGLALAAMVCLLAAPASAGIVYTMTNASGLQNGWALSGTITVSGTGTNLGSADITSWAYTVTDGSASHTYSSTNQSAFVNARGLLATPTQLIVKYASEGARSPNSLGLNLRGGEAIIEWNTGISGDFPSRYDANDFPSTFWSNQDLAFPLTATQGWVIGTVVSAVPEIDPAGMGSVLALVTGALGLLERRRLKTA
jgi:hypothetical protein